MNNKRHQDRMCIHKNGYSKLPVRFSNFLLGDSQTARGNPCAVHNSAPCIVNILYADTKTSYHEDWGIIF